VGEEKSFPPHALERLAGLRREGHPSGVFTSDFSVNEFLLVRKAGFEPIGLCVGSCIYRMGVQFTRLSSSVELTVLSTAMYEARALAMERMRAEARQMGADGIVGVRLTVKRAEWDAKVLEFVAIGTGVVHAGGHPGFKGPAGEPFTSALTGQDFWTLLKSGYRPLEMVMGSCVYHVSWSWPLQSLMSVGQNVELTNYSIALYEARELAMERMQLEATKAGAEGVIGSDLHEGNHGWSAHTIEFFAIGTAVLPLQGASSQDIPDPQFVLSVNG
jgi:uncharacterized protein YbjQ (UPF0145 family)